MTTVQFRMCLNYYVLENMFCVRSHRNKKHKYRVNVKVHI